MNSSKEKAGQLAASLIEDDMIVGLGTGSTAQFFINALTKRCKEGLKIKAVATSQGSEILARQGGIPMIDIRKITSIDIDVDGADEIDPQKRLIKGGGGALLREKIVAAMSKEMIVIADETKLVDTLGAFGLPIEIVAFAAAATEKHLEDAGFNGSLRYQEKGLPFITDNGNYIFDIEYPKLCHDPEGDHQKIIAIPGVVETGFFLNMAKKIIIGEKYVI